MDKNIIESMDVTSYSKEDLDSKVEEFLNQDWELYTGVIDESVITDDVSGITTITYTQTLVKY